MEITESNSDGLKREIKIVVGAKEIDEKVSARLDELKGQVQLKGFRPGKVPVAHLRKMYGKQVAAEIVQQMVTESSQKALDDGELRPAFQPEIKLTEDEDEINQILDGKADLSYSMEFEVIPDIEVGNLGDLKIERPVAEVSDEEVDKQIEELRANSTTYEKVDDATAEIGDQVTIDFVGRIDGEEFDGGKADDAPVVIGREAFIPGFEEGLIGVKEGDEKDIKTTFPEDYPADKLAGKDAVFSVTVKEVGKPQLPDLDDEFAKTMGFEEFAKLKEQVRESLQDRLKAMSREKAKRHLLDQLDEGYTFELPPTLVEKEFEGIWNQVTQQLEQAGKTFEDEGKSEDETREEYQQLSTRRVRLGLLLAHIAEKNDIQVSEDELRQRMFEEVRNYPGQEQQVFEFYQKNPGALAQLRGPLLEDKTVDFILELATVTDKPVTTEELLKPDDDDEEAVTDTGGEGDS